MTPAVAAYRMACALAMGAGLGLLYGFLRPLRPRYTLTADGAFLLAALWTWIYLSFGVCAGDIRAGFAIAMMTGGVLWESTAGRLLRPIFAGFWKILARTAGTILLPVKKFFVFLKFLFASVEKWVTIVKNHIWPRRDRRRGKSHERIQNRKV